VLQIEQQEEYLICKIEELKALHEEHEKLKHSHTFLIGKHENLEKKYACASNVSSCVDPLEKENANLRLGSTLASSCFCCLCSIRRGSALGLPCLLVMVVRTGIDFLGKLCIAVRSWQISASSALSQFSPLCVLLRVKGRCAQSLFCFKQILFGLSRMRPFSGLGHPGAQSFGLSLLLTFCLRLDAVGVQPDCARRVREQNG
jgi:hypothetical protein